MINFIIWIIVGGILGWVASMVMRTDAQQGTFFIKNIFGGALCHEKYTSRFFSPVPFSL